MKKLLATLVLFLVAACADNPLGLAEGMWVKHKIDGQKYYITLVDIGHYNDEGGLGYIRVKNELGVTVDKNFAIHEFDMWVDGNAEETRSNRQFGLLIKELTAARKAYEDNPSQETKEHLGEVIDMGDRAVTADSPIFAPKKWNSETQKYE